LELMGKLFSGVHCGQSTVNLEVKETQSERRTTSRFVAGQRNL
jgi:hypothetical protein